MGWFRDFIRHSKAVEDLTKDCLKYKDRISTLEGCLTQEKEKLTNQLEVSSKLRSEICRYAELEQDLKKQVSELEEQILLKNENLDKQDEIMEESEKKLTSRIMMYQNAVQAAKEALNSCEEGELSEQDTSSP